MWFRVAILLGQTVGLALIGVGGAHFSSLKGSRVLGVMSVALAPLILVPLIVFDMGFALPLAAVLALAALSGLGFAALLVRLGLLLRESYKDDLTFVMGLGLLFGVVFYVTLVSMVGLVLYLALAGTPWAICGLGLLADSLHDKHDEPDAIPDVSNDLKSAASAVIHRFFLLFLVYSAIFAMIQFVVVVMRALPYQYHFFWLALFAGGLFLLGYGRFAAQRVNPEAALRLLIPLLAVGFLPFPFLPPGPRTFSYILIAVAFVALDSMSLYFLLDVITRNRLAAVRLFSFGRLATTAGMLLGCLCAIGINQAVGNGEPLAFYISMGSIAILMVVTAFFGMSILDYHAFQRSGSLSRGRKRNQEAGAYGERFAVSGSDGGEKALPDGSDGAGRRPWQECCDAIIGEYYLSPREAEVFGLLARGRDAKYVCDSLVVSPSTAKSHIYNIYRKLDIHSQQELIDMVEDRFRS